jgi:ELWxxDGT repeat protein
VSGITWMKVLNGVLYFAADDGVNGLELWKSDGTADGTVRVTDIMAGGGSSSPSYPVVAGNALYFTANDGEHGVEVWQYVPEPPNGDLTGNDALDVPDVLRALRIASGVAEPSMADFIHGDVAPLGANGLPAPDGIIDMEDALVVLRKMLGVLTW